jgi:uncharacterized membrane protein YgcG
MDLIVFKIKASEVWVSIKTALEWLCGWFLMLCIASVMLGFCLGVFMVGCDIIFGWGKFLLPIVICMIGPPGVALALVMCLIDCFGSSTTNSNCGGGSGGGSGDGNDSGGPTPGYGGMI